MTVLMHGRLFASVAGEEWGFSNNRGHERSISIDDILGPDFFIYDIQYADYIDPLPVERIKIPGKKKVSK